MLIILLIGYLTVGLTVWLVSPQSQPDSSLTAPERFTIAPMAGPGEIEVMSSQRSRSKASGATSPAPLPEPEPESALPPGAPAPTTLAIAPLIIPVANVSPKDLRDTYHAARGGGRSHNAIDIMAPRGTPVLAATDGKIARFYTSERGGITLYQLSPDNSVVFYYAHLDSYADGLTEGQVVRRGEVIAYVGNTGNAGPDNYHLHFAIWLVTDPKRYWHGTNINPYPLLSDQR